MENKLGRNIIPSNEEQRIKALQRYQLLQTVPQGYFNNLAQIMALTFDVPIALVSLVDKEAVHFHANAGMEETSQTPRGVSLCSLSILEDEPTIFKDTLEEPCLLANPLVTGDFGLRFYAGAPITTKDGYNIGTVCIVDKEPRSISEKEKKMLQHFAYTAMEDLEVRRNALFSGELA